MGFKNWISRLFKKEDKQDNFINYIKSIQNSSIKLLKKIESIEKEKNNLIAAVQAHKEKPDLAQKLKKTIEDELEMIEALIKNYRILTSHFYRRKVYRKMNKHGNEELTAAVLKLSDNAREVRDKLKQAKNSMQYGLRYLEDGKTNRFLAEHQNEQKRAEDISDIVEDAAPNVALIARETHNERMKTWGQYLTSGIAHLSRAAVLLIALAGAMISGCAPKQPVKQPKKVAGYYFNEYYFCEKLGYKKDLYLIDDKFTAIYDELKEKEPKYLKKLERQAKGMREIDEEAKEAMEKSMLKHLEEWEKRYKKHGAISGESEEGIKQRLKKLEILRKKYR